MIGRLPGTLSVGGTEYEIRTDYRNVLDVFSLFNDPELTKEEKWICAVYMLFKIFQEIDDVIEAIEEGFNISDAAAEIIWFINGGKEVKKEENEKHLYSWEMDEQMIFSSVNKVANKEIREEEYMHWWTFLGYFNEIEEGTFSFIVGIREKINNGKKLERHEREFYQKNRELVDIKRQKSKEELEQEEEYNEFLKEYLG